MKRLLIPALTAAVLVACSGGGGGGNATPTTPAIHASTASLAFAAWTGKAQGPEIVTLTNGGSGTLATPSADVQYTTGSGWLNVSVTGSSAPFTLNVTAQPGALAPGTYTARIQLAAAGATGASINATLTVTQSWTVFVYGSADHNLTPSLLTDIIEMSQATIAPNVTILVAADYSSGLLDSKTGQPVVNPWTNTPVPSGTEWYLIKGGNQVPQLLGTEAEQNFDDPAVLRTAVADVFANFPADRYGIVMWDHGGSWDYGFGGDWSNAPANPGTSNGMKSEVVAAAVTAGLGDAGIAGTRPLDFFAFDTCLMAGNEVAFEFKNLSKTYLACAEIDFGNGWNYGPTFSWLSSNSTATATAFAANEVTFWNQQHQGGKGDQLMRSHVALDTAKFTTYADRWKDLIASMDASSTLDLIEVARTQYGVSPGYSVPSEPTANSHYRDAGLFLSNASNITSDPAVAAAATAANASLSDAILGSSQGTIRVAAGQKGVHVEMPVLNEWSTYASAYKALAWDVHTNWSLLIDALVANADATAPTVVSAIVNDTNPTAANPPTVQFGSDDADVAEARVYIAQVSNGSVFFYGLAGLTAADPGSVYEFAWGGKLIQLTNGTAVSPITIVPWVNSAGGTVVLAPGVLSLGGEDYEASAAIDDATGAVIAFFLNIPGNSVTVSLQQAAGGTFTPAVFEVQSQTTVAGTPLALSTTNPALAAVELSAPAGTYAIVSAMGDVWGNWGRAIDNVTIVNPF